MEQVISLLVENRSGVLSNVVGLFSQRGYNIESLNVAPTEDPSISCITLTTSTDRGGTEQVVKQLNKLIDVIKVVPFDPSVHVAREMALVRVRVTREKRAEVLALVNVFRVRVIHASSRNYIFEVTGQSDKIDAFLKNLRLYGVSDLHRTGTLALSRGETGEKKISAGDRAKTIGGFEISQT